MARRRLTPQQIVKKQIARAQAAVQDYVDGVNAVMESPNAKAAQKVNKYAAGVQQAVSSGKYVNANNNVSLQSWQKAAAGKGSARYAPGVADAEPKLMQFQTQYGPVRDSIADQVNQMPDDTFEQRLAKADANARKLHASPYKK